MTSLANHTPLHNDVSPKLEVTLTCLYCYDCQPLWLWYDLYGDKAEKGSFSDFDRVIMEDGVLHEAEIIKGMNLQAVGECDPSAAIAATLKLMQEGAELIYQGVIEAEIDGVIYRGRPDLLKRIECLSTLGS